MTFGLKNNFYTACGSDLIGDLHKHFFKFKDDVPIYGRTANNSFLGTYKKLL